MHVRFNHRICSLLGSCHDQPAYRVDDSVSDFKPSMTSTMEDVKTRASPSLKFSYGSRDALPGCFRFVDVLPFLIQSGWTCTRLVPKSCTLML
jgi:hypothetical protein